METIKVLVFAANPHGTVPLDLSREFREIDEEIHRGRYRDVIELILVPGTRPVDLLRKLNENQPQIVHFSSHGNPDELVLESGDDEAAGPGRGATSARSMDDRDMNVGSPEPADQGGTSPSGAHVVSKSALVHVLRSCGGGNLRLVVLNACHSRSQAESLTEVVDCVVSMNRTISDRGAIKFAASFYGALAFGRSVRTAFEQGVARLSAEGIAEVDTPELLVRAGVDAGKLMLVGPAPLPAPRRPTPSAAEGPFIVPFPRNADFVGRDGDLARLHATLSGASAAPVGIRPAGLTGMGGVGKTQLAVEYVHRYRDHYPDGIFWIDAAGDLADGFARLATDHRVRWAEPDRPRDEQIRAAFVELNRRPQALLVLDNLANPAAIAVPLLPDCVPEDLRCRLLFTTRRHDLGRFTGVEVTVLPEEPALRLLLRHPSRQAALDPANPDHEHARAIARMLGRLPLALELAGAYLGKYSGDISLESYREGLRSDGALATLDADAAELTEADLRRVHAPAVAATIREQWESLGDEPARLLLRVASLFAESAAIPIARLGLLAGLGDEARPGRRSPLRRAAQRLDDTCLAERLESEQIRLHPLIGEFAAGRTPSEQVDELRRQCVDRAATALEQFPMLEALITRRGVDALQDDLAAIVKLCPLSDSAVSARLQAVLRLLQREGNQACVRNANSQQLLFAQQVRNRAAQLGIGPLRWGAEQRLEAAGQPHFRLIWTASRESASLIRTFTGHEDWVTAVAVTCDGQCLLSGGFYGTLKLWNLQTGQLLRSFAGHKKAVRAVAVTPDGRQAISASHDHTLRLWDLASAQLVRTFSGHRAAVSAVTVARDGRVLSGAHDGTLRLWDLQTGRLRFTFTAGSTSDDVRYTGDVHQVSAVAVSSDGRHAVSASYDGTLRVYELTTCKFIHSWAGHKVAVSTVAVTPDGSQALSGSHDFTLRLWNLATGQLIRSFGGHEDQVTTVEITGDGRHAVSGSRDRTLRLWDLANGELLRSFSGHEDGVTELAVTPDDRHVVSASSDRTLMLWDLATGNVLHPAAGHNEKVSAVAVTPDGRLTLSASHDRTVRLWELATGHLLHSFTGHDDQVMAVAVTADGRHAISASHDRTLKLWDLATGQLLRSFTGHEDGVSSVAVTPDGRHAVSGSYDRTLRLWDLANRKAVYSCTGHERAVSAVAITPDGRHAVSASHDRTLRLWDLGTGLLVANFLGHNDAVSAVAVTPCGAYAVSASSDRTLRLWDLGTGQSLRTYSGHESAVSAVAVTRDGRHALSGSRDRTIRLWDINQGVCQAIAPLENSPSALAVAPDGRSVIVGDRVGNVHHFQIHLG